MLMGGGRGVAVPISCPFCRAAAAELVSLFGSQLLLSQYRCTLCGSYFEGLRQDRWDAEPPVPATEGIDNGSRTEH
jgi:transposase-like protein